MKTVIVILNMTLRAENCFVLIVLFNVILTECVMKFVCVKSCMFLLLFYWGNKGGVPAHAGILVDFCDVRGAGTTQWYW